jgi:hypothetical protein
MRGETSKDGKMTGNVQLVRGHDMHKGGGGLKGASKGSPDGGKDEGGSDHGEIDSVVAEHGPAQSHTITDNQDGTFSSQTTHASGHVHEKHGHPSLEHAHEHGEHAMGEGMDDGKEQVMEEHEAKPMGMGKVSHSGAGGY